ncbi:MAG: bile acid:sodium symporter [Alphaproteobacteria bacterium]|nr:bile acid:sodium symporter [Alphaproteobacteria bacterium]MBU1513888.1 bile acid:sodium symporter [Alphaproteobacteria bacterium]MBU2094467.1 bile acid:sodium symporter [Alphaproteobacteria bacterium]MBU2149807.1 bile acid:sodium symporter [Alphaproteobacteria bacterium]MBU2307278.1 bile acid:sodium symporter [Alphaproteobacteria bacterium]
MTKGRLGRFKPDWYLVLILLMAAAAAVLPARGEAAVWFGWVTKVAIALVFFLHGSRLSREAVIGGLRHWRLHLLVLACTFGLFPLLTLGVVALPAWITPPELATGIVFLGCLPSTVQSSIAFVGVARGNVPAAVASASASNLLGVFLTPLLVGVLLHAQGGISAESFWAIVGQLLVPFVAGQLLRPWIGDWVKARNGVLSKLDRGSILLVVYTAFSGAVVAGVWSMLSPLDLIRLLVICALLLAAILGLTLFAARSLGFSKTDEIAIVFCGSKKSLASGAPMAAAIFAPAVAGVALIPLMIFHQIQLMACAAIAQRYAQRPDTEPQNG